MAAPARLQPFAHDGFRFTAFIARHPIGIDIRSIERIEAKLHQLIQNSEGLRLIHGPAKDIAAENHGRDKNAGTAQFDFLHGALLCRDRVPPLAVAGKGAGHTLLLEAPRRDLA